MFRLLICHCFCFFSKVMFRKFVVFSIRFRNWFLNPVNKIINSIYFLLQQVKSSKFAAQFEWKKSQCTPSFYVTQWFNFGRWGYRKWWRPQKIHSGCKESFISQRSYSVLGSRKDQHLSRNYSKTLIWFNWLRGKVKRNLFD